MKDCLVDKCVSLARARGYCDRHYDRWRRHGDPLGGGKTRRPKNMTNLEIFTWYMPDDPPAIGCWDWLGPVDDNEYGKLTFNRPKIYAHRISYQLYKGDIPTGLEILHRCDRPICIQPSHLRVGTHKENMLEVRLRGRYALVRSTLNLVPC
jgi:hypothetical protein